MPAVSQRASRSTVSGWDGIESCKPGTAFPVEVGATSKPVRKKLVRRIDREYSQPVRLGVQLFLVVLNLWIGVQFYCSRPPASSGPASGFPDERRRSRLFGLLRSWRSPSGSTRRSGAGGRRSSGFLWHRRGNRPGGDPTPRRSTGAANASYLYQVHLYQWLVENGFGSALTDSGL